MSIVDFKSLIPEKTKVWIFPLRDELSESGRSVIEGLLPELLSGWKAHGEALEAGFAIQYSRFLIVGADQSHVSASGCSIDTLFRGISGLVRKADNEIEGGDSVFFQRSDRIWSCSREEFAEMVQRGEILPSTIVFNNSVTKLSEVLGGDWETAFENSWHAKAFPLPEPVVKTEQVGK